MSDQQKITAACETCAGRGIVDMGTCPDCLGSGDETDAWLVFEKFLNANVAQRLGEGAIEEHMLAAMWGSKMDPWARQLADDHEAESDVLEFEDSEFCERNECGGCREKEAPCESYKLWFAAMQMARAIRAESRKIENHGEHGGHGE